MTLSDCQITPQSATQRCCGAVGVTPPCPPTCVTSAGESSYRRRVLPPCTSYPPARAPLASLRPSAPTLPRLCHADSASLADYGNEESYG